MSQQWFAMQRFAADHQVCHAINTLSPAIKLDAIGRSDPLVRPEKVTAAIEQLRDLLRKVRDVLELRPGTIPAGVDLYIRDLARSIDEHQRAESKSARTLEERAENTPFAQLGIGQLAHLIEERKWTDSDSRDTILKGLEKLRELINRNSLEESEAAGL